MAANSISPLPAEDRPLTQEEWWDFVMSLYGSGKEMFASVGGGQAWVRYLREGAPVDSEG